ncbi:30991_t:CDS:1 [Gigaspora margarita]|uniref:30991_t:CDS:1 n=1 Tax=Gigaspora margarita TaxID=4874 RepID=A0ABN7XKM7_GIGMA|nr:30991_t:CDS:1 [Gigaspora margarita]
MEQQIINLLYKNNFTTEKHKSNRFSILKASFGQYYFYLFFLDIKILKEKYLNDVEKARSDFYKNKNVHKDIISILICKKDVEEDLDIAIRRIEMKKDFKFDFFYLTVDELIDFLKNDIYDNHFCLFYKAFIAENKKIFIQFMKNTVKNPEDIDKYSIEL